MGFGHFLDLVPFRLNRRLLDAVIEWWRPETNSFHFITGEMSLTMEDMVRIVGLSVAGEPVVGRKEDDYRATSTELLGQPYPTQGTRKGLIELVWLRNTFKEKRPNEGEAAADHQLRAFIMFLFGSTIFCDVLGKMVDGIFLQFLRDLKHVRVYSWGSAGLAVLYHALYSRSRDRGSLILGFLPLIQIWLYEHINIGRPILKEKMHHLFPRARRWEEKNWEGGMHHQGTFFRQEFALIKPHQITWRPYKIDEDKDVAVVQESEPLFLREIWMICIEKIERHMPGRVLRQYGLPQGIPVDPTSRERMSMIGGQDCDYTKLYQLEIADWLSRGTMVQGPREDKRVDEVAYEEWYSAMYMRKLLPSGLQGETCCSRPGLHETATEACGDENAKLRADLMRVMAERDAAVKALEEKEMENALFRQQIEKFSSVESAFTLSLELTRVQAEASGARAAQATLQSTIDGLLETIRDLGRNHRMHLEGYSHSRSGAPHTHSHSHSSSDCMLSQSQSSTRPSLLEHGMASAERLTERDPHALRKNQ